MGAGDNLDGLSQDRDYQKAMAHMQRGEWPEAIRELEQLLAQNPGSASLADDAGGCAAARPV